MEIDKGFPICQVRKQPFGDPVGKAKSSELSDGECMRHPIESLFEVDVDSVYLITRFKSIYSRVHKGKEVSSR